MSLSLALSVGYRYARAGKKRGMMSFLSSISMAGLVLGISLLVVVLSVMNGFERELRERILGLVPQAAIYKAGGIENWPEFRKEILQYPGIVEAAPFIQVNALISFRRSAQPALIYGIDPEAEQGVSRLDEFVHAEARQALKENDAALVLGKAIAEKLGLALGQNVLVIVPAENGGAPRLNNFTLVQILDTATELDQSLVLVNLRAARSLSDLPENRVEGLRLKLENMFDAPSIMYALTISLGPSYYQSNWKRTHGNLYHAIKVSKNMVALLMSLIVALAAFNVVSTLILVVIEKQANIAILRTLGASSATILGIFITQGMLIGVGGVALGMVLGLALATCLQPLVAFIEAVFGMQFLHSDVYPLTYIPTQIVVGDLVQIAAIGLALTFVATLYPAWKASKLQPAEALRYE